MTLNTTGTNSLKISDHGFQHDMPKTLELSLILFNGRSYDRIISSIPYSLRLQPEKYTQHRKIYDQNQKHTSGIVKYTITTVVIRLKPLDKRIPNTTGEIHLAPQDVRLQPQKFGQPKNISTTIRCTFTTREIGLAS